MSALAHEMEREGIATAVVALVRLHAEKVRPPRALWVPFELGLPLGAPGDEAFRLRVIRAALALLERREGPHLLEDFPDESPDAAGDPAWKVPVAAGAEDVAEELAAARAAHALWIERTGRTTVGVSGLEPEQALTYLESFARGDAPDPPRRDLHPAQLVRFAADDLKALYLEAASLGPGNPNGAQLRAWLWRETTLARLFHRLRERCLADEDETLRTIGDGALVPYEWRRDPAS